MVRPVILLVPPTSVEMHSASATVALTTTLTSMATVKNVTGHAHVVAIVETHVTNVIQPVRHATIHQAQADLMNVLHVTVELNQIPTDTVPVMTIMRELLTHVTSNVMKDVPTVPAPENMNAFSVKLTTK
jgi:hypothetical protein